MNTHDTLINQNPEKYTNVETDLDIRAGEIGYVLKKG